MSRINSDVLELNEVSFLERLNQDPLNLDDLMMAFLKKNPDKLDLVMEAKEFDLRLIEVLSIEPPVRFADKIITKNGFSKSASNDSNWFERLSLVAASFLVVAVGFWAWQSNNIGLGSQPSQVASLTSEIGSKTIEHLLEHAVDQVGNMEVTKLDVADAELQKIFKFVGATLHKSIDTMSYAGACIVDGKQGLHVVIQENTGAVTVIVMPGETLELAQSFDKNGYVASLIPVKGAVVAIIGKTASQVSKAQIRFFKAVDFG